MKLTDKEKCSLLCGLNALVDNARKAQELVFDAQTEESIEEYIQFLGELNIKVQKL